MHHFPEQFLEAPARDDIPEQERRRLQSPARCADTRSYWPRTLSGSKSKGASQRRTGKLGGASSQARRTLRLPAGPQSELDGIRK